MSLRTLNAKLDATLHEFAKLDLGYTYDDPQAAKKADAKKKEDGLAVEMSSKFQVSGSKLNEFAHTPMGGAYPAGSIGAGDIGRTWRRGGLKALPNMRKQVAGVIRQSRKDPKRQIIKANSPRMSKFSEFSDRTRNGDGQFVGNVTGGADPVTMRQAYGHKPQRSLLAPGAGAAALAGAGLLGTQAGRGMTIKAAKGAARMVRSSVAGLDRKIKGKTGAMWPRMGSKAKPKQREGLGEVILRSAKGKTGPRFPRSGD